jgi:hypothetical protein
MLIPHEFIYRGDLAALGDFHSKCFADCLCDGEIVSVYFEAESVSSFSGTWYFGLKVNGSDVLAGTDRVQITSGDLEVEKTGLAIAVNLRDRFSPTIDTRGAGTINGPITVIIWVKPSSKTTPVDADYTAFADSAASDKTKSVSWAHIKATLKTYFDTLYTAAAQLGTGEAVVRTDDVDDIVKIGDVDNLGNSTLIAVDDQNLSIDILADDSIDVLADDVKVGPSSWFGLKTLFTGMLTIIGDHSAGGNGTKITVNDALQTITASKDLIVPDEVYDATNWNGSLEVPTKNAVRNKIEALVLGGGSYTDEQAQDAVGTILDDSGDIDFTYDDATPKITAIVKNDAVTFAKFQNITTARLLGRNTAGSGDMEELDASTIRTLLSLVLGTNVQAWDTDLDAIAALAASNDDVIQRKAGAWTNRTMAQLVVDLQGDGLSSPVAGFRNIPQNSQSTNYTLVAADSGKHIFHPSADTTARTFTIPANSSVAFPIGTTITFINQVSGGAISIAIATEHDAAGRSRDNRNADTGS